MKLRKLLSAVIAATVLLSCAAFEGCEKGTESETPTVAPIAQENSDDIAKIIIIAGQSNMAGASYHQYLKNNISDERYAALVQGYENIQIMFNSGAIDAPSHEWHTSKLKFTKVKAGQGAPTDGQAFGPELGIAEYLSEQYPDEKFYIVKQALGGAYIDEFLNSDGRADCWGILTDMMDKALEQVAAETKLEVQVAAVCWMQGESDGFTELGAEVYGLSLEELVTRIRNQYKDYAPERGIAFIDATINDDESIIAAHAGVNAAKEEFMSMSELNYLVYTNEAGLTCEKEPPENPDLYHYDSESQLKLGRLFGEKIAEALEAAYDGLNKAQ